MVTAHRLAVLYGKVHDQLRNIDGLQPQEAFDELLKYLFFKQCNEELGPDVSEQLALFAVSEMSMARRNLAIRIRELFKQYLAKANSWSTEVWTERNFRLSDGALVTVHDHLSHVTFSKLSVDVRSSALREFLSPELRKGLGIFLTPEPVVRMAVELLDPPLESRVYDPACGSGSFLIDVVRAWQAKGPGSCTVYGSDKSGRMLLLAELNLEHIPGVTFRKRLADTLVSSDLFSDRYPWPKPESMDYVITNPPFGVSVTGEAIESSSFSTWRGGQRTRQSSEILFIEQCLKLLKPGGELAIVVPRSVITNAGFTEARKLLGELGYVRIVVLLPPETFALAGTQTTTAVLFMRKYGAEETRADSNTIVVGDVSNVGYDSTGRPRSGSELETLPKRIKVAAADGQDRGGVRVLRLPSKGDSLAVLADALMESQDVKAAVELADLVTLISTGRTPPRSQYSEEGHFLVKVGNLSGQGIDWTPRERNYISKLSRSSVILQAGDILLTSSAHTPKYIAKKVDIFDKVPDFISKEVSVVGEVMVIRPKSSVDPYALLAFLRLPATQEKLQRMIRGQTAHLMPSDVARLKVPLGFISGGPEIEPVRGLLVEQQELSQRLNVTAAKLRAACEELTGRLESEAM